MTHPDIVQRLRDDEGELESRFAITRCSGEQQIANELRLIASETECGQRQMHLEIAAQIVEQGQFLHPSDFVFAIQADEAATEITTLRQQLAEAREALADGLVGKAIIILDGRTTPGGNHG